MDGAAFAEQRGTKMKDEIDDIPATYLLYVVIGILAMVAVAIILIARIFRHI